MKKKKEMYPMLVFTDQKFILEMTQEIESAKIEFQKLLDLWNGSDLKPITTYKELFRLIYDPSGVYKDAGLSGMLPQEIYIQAGKCKSSIHNGRLELWLIEDSKTVVINDSEFQRFTHINDISCQNDIQAQFARDVVKYVELSNSISTTLMALPTDRLPAVPFSVTGKYLPIISSLKLETEYLQEILKAM